MVTWRSNFMTHGWHFLRLFVCSSSRRAISDIHLREVWVYIALAPRLLILTIWVNFPEFPHSVYLGCARTGVVQGVGGLQNSRWRWFHCHGNQTACGEGSRSGELGRGHRSDMLLCSCTYFSNCLWHGNVTDGDSSLERTIGDLTLKRGALHLPGLSSQSSWLKCFPLIHWYISVGELGDICS